MALYELKTGNGGYGLEPFNTVTGKYEKVGFDFEGNQINGWEELRDLMLDLSQQQIYSASDDSFKKQVDDYIKEQYSMLLKQEIDKLNNEYEVKNLKRFTTVEEFISNADKVFTIKLFNDFNNLYKQKSDYYILNGRTVSTLAVVLQKNRYPLSMKEITKEKYENVMANVPKFNYSSWHKDDIMKYVDENDIIPVFRGLGETSKSIDELKDQFLNSKSAEFDTMLGRHSGNMGSVIYMSPSNSQAGNFGSGLVLKGYVEKKSAKILNLGNKYKYSSDTIVDSFEKNFGNIISAARTSFSNNGIPYSDANNIIDSLKDAINQRDIGIIGMLMGYDAISGNKYEFDILNPGIVNLRGDFYG